MHPEQVPTTSDTAPVPPATHVVLFGLWGIQFDANNNKLIAFTPKMPDGSMGHVHAAAVWNSPSSIAEVQLRAGAAYSVISTGAQTVSMEKLIGKVKSRNHGMFINSDTVDLDISDCLTVDLGHPTDMYPLVVVDTGEQFDGNYPDIDDKRITLPGSFYPGVWGLTYDQPTLTLRLPPNVTLVGDPSNNLELHTRPSMDMEDHSARLHATMAYSMLMSHFTRKNSLVELDIRFDWTATPDCSSPYQAESGIPAAEVDCNLSRALFDTGMFTRPANCAGGGGTLFVPFTSFS
jgi:hypothetical protein